MILSFPTISRMTFELVRTRLVPPNDGDPAEVVVYSEWVYRAS